MHKLLPSVVFLLACLLPHTLVATTAPPLKTDSSLPKIAIILDDLGYNRIAGERALQLNGAITYAIIPFTPFSTTFAEQAHLGNREVILHMPMQSSDATRKLDEGGIATTLSETEIRERVNNAIENVPHIVGMNNHMGSEITSNVQIMHWLMQEIEDKPLFYVDSLTHPQSVAKRSAQHYNIPSLERDVFLDNIQTEANIDRMFRSLVRIAKQRGHAIAIGHPYPATLDYLEKALSSLEQQGVQLVKASELVMQYGTPVDQPVDIDHLMEMIVAMPAPESHRLNFTNEGIY